VDKTNAQEMTTVVCDSSVLVKLLVTESDTEQALALVETYRVAVPEFAFLEVGNVLWFRVRNRASDLNDALDLLDRLHGLGFAVKPIAPLVARALAIGSALGHPIYDCLYLALAESLGVPLVTADRRFNAALRRGALDTVPVHTLAGFA
jgi:predicted nucleic acid-binding protein